MYAIEPKIAFKSIEKNNDTIIDINPRFFKFYKNKFLCITENNYFYEYDLNSKKIISEEKLEHTEKNDKIWESKLQKII